MLSIDIDGNDYHVWQSMTRYQPRIVIIEYNPTAANDVVFIQDPDDTLNQGCSLLALILLGKERAMSWPASRRAMEFLFAQTRSPRWALSITTSTPCAAMRDRV